MRVDGFRFDLGVTLGREGTGFDPGSGFFDAVLQDPELAAVKLIAEPWDIGPGGYQVGNIPPGLAEWNDRYRDTVRRFWRGDEGQRGDMAARLTASGDLFDRRHRRPWASVNFVTAHDGFTLRDVVSYNGSHNEANGENDEDGHAENYSSNWGEEGPTEDEAVLERRARVQRALLATLLLSQGTPMLLAGDEFGHSQHGNNNAYCQDSPLSWLDWTEAQSDQGRGLSQARGAGAGAAARPPVPARRPVWRRGARSPPRHRRHQLVQPRRPTHRARLLGGPRRAGHGPAPRGPSRRRQRRHHAAAAQSRRRGAGVHPAGAGPGLDPRTGFVRPDASGARQRCRGNGASAEPGAARRRPHAGAGGMTAWPEPFSFGALPLPDGRTRFRLWAPSAAPGLALLIEGRDAIALHPDAQGYAQVDVDCGPGTRYRYRLGDGAMGCRTRPRACRTATCTTPAS